MSETKINIKDLKNEGSNVVDDLVAFLKEQTKREIESETDDITLKSAGEKETQLSRTYLRMLIRKFLHRSELKEFYRVIGGKENALVVRERKLRKEEE